MTNEEIQSFREETKMELARLESEVQEQKRMNKKINNFKTYARANNIDVQIGKAKLLSKQQKREEAIFSASSKYRFGNYASSNPSNIYSI